MMTIDRPQDRHTAARRALWREAFGDSDAFLDTFWRTAYSPDRCRCVTAGEDVAAALYWFDCLHGGEPIAYLYAVATASVYRGQGLCHRLMEDTHRHLAAQGYAGVMLVPGDAGLYRFYAGMGYRTCTHLRTLSCHAEAGESNVHRVDPQEYAALRRGLLPRGGVVQEGANLDFLATQTSLYAGDGFLLAARVRGEELYGLEWLGDLSHAPAVTHALGCRRGILRTPGGTVPFAMYLPLRMSAPPPPDYFGLAHD